MIEEKELEIYWNFLHTKTKLDGIFSINRKIIKTDYNGFSKNFFVNNYADFVRYVKFHSLSDCYITYNSLKTEKNRKNENVAGISMISLDVEFETKQIPESLYRIQFLLKSLKTFAERNRIVDYLITNSGNGCHMYIPVDKFIEEDIKYLKPAYNAFVKELSQEIYRISKYSVKADDRKDLAGILRIPQTYNNKAGKKVEILYLHDSEILDENFAISAKLRKYIRRAKKQQKIQTKNKKYSKKVCSNLKVNELYENPIVKLLFDDTLPEIEGWHSTIIFAIQAMISEAGLQNTAEINELESDINSTWDCSVSLSNCSTNEATIPILGAIKFCRKNNLDDYAKEISKFMDGRNNEA